MCKTMCKKKTYKRTPIDSMMAAAAAWMKCGWWQVIGSCFSAFDNTIRTFIQLNSLGFLLSFDEKFDSYKSTILEISKRSTCTAYTQTHTHTILQFVFIVIDFITSAIVINKINCTKCAITMVKRRSSPPPSSSSACRTFSIAFTFPISCVRAQYICGSVWLTWIAHKEYLTFEFIYEIVCRVVMLL